MRKVLISLVSVLVLTAAFAPAALGAGLNCDPRGDGELLRYSWKLKGGLAWIAGLAFPTSGKGEMHTVASSASINSRLMITSRQGSDGYYLYQSEIDPTGDRTLVSYHGYAWGKKSRRERTLFDYVKRLARIRKETPDKVEDKVKKIPADDMRDVLTGIFYLRQNSDSITQPFYTQIYSDGTIYPVMFRPSGSAQMTYQGEKIPVQTFLITAVPGSEKRWPGGVKVWLSEDERRIPLRIELQANFAALQLNLDSIDSCALELPKDK